MINGRINAGWSAPAAFLELLAAAAGAGFVSPHLGLHGFSDRALVDRDPEWHPVRVNRHDGIGQLIGELVAPGLGGWVRGRVRRLLFHGDLLDEDAVGRGAVEVEMSRRSLAPRGAFCFGLVELLDAGGALGVLAVHYGYSR